MSTSALSVVTDLKEKRGLIQTSLAAVIAQLAVLLVGILVTMLLGAKPDTALGYYQIMGSNPVAGLLIDDSFSLLLIVLYLFSFTGLFFLCREKHFSLAFFATLLTFTAVILAVSTHSGFSLLHLSEKYSLAIDETTKTQLLAAGEAVIAQNMWFSSAGFFSGVFLQGAGVIMSLAMLGNDNFRKLTIIAGIIANGLDLINHLIHYSLPELASIFLYIAGPFYLIWYVMLIFDLSRILKRNR
jgi:hypothetical protein